MRSGAVGDILEKPKFIVFEGIDGSGKTTQALLLYDWLTKRGYNVVYTEEPTRDLITGQTMKILLGHKEGVPKEVYLLYFLSDRIYHIKRTILPSIETGKIVVSDRYHFSTLAYQTAQGIPRETIEGVLKLLGVDLPLPDITILIDLPPEEAITRVSNRKEKVISNFEKVNFLERVRENYLKLAEEFNFIVVDGTKDPLEVHNRIVRKLKKYFPPIR